MTTHSVFDDFSDLVSTVEENDGVDVSDLADLVAAADDSHLDVEDLAAYNDLTSDLSKKEQKALDQFVNDNELSVEDA